MVVRVEGRVTLGAYMWSDCMCEWWCKGGARVVQGWCKGGARVVQGWCKGWIGVEMSLDRNLKLDYYWTRQSNLDYPDVPELDCRRVRLPALAGPENLPPITDWSHAGRSIMHVLNAHLTDT
jgi:hypothetical protein